MLSSKNSMMKILQKKHKNELYGSENVNKQLLDMKELYLGRIPTTKGVREIAVEIKP